MNHTMSNMSFDIEKGSIGDEGLSDETAIGNTTWGILKQHAMR